MIKTINLKANEETQIDVVGGTHVKIKNLGDSTVYVSKHSDIVPSADGVKSIQGNTTDILVDVATYSSKENTLDYYGTIYALAESDCSIELETTNNSNFKFVKKGGDGSTSVVEGVGEYYSVDSVKKGEIFNDYGHNVASGKYSHAEGYVAVASGDCSHAEGNYNNATGANSHAEGASNKATNACSHAEGYMTTANGKYSHTQGFSTTADGESSHAEGGGTKANACNSHAEGGGTTAKGENSHAEGGGTKSIGRNSHAEGCNSTSNGENSHVEGAYTIAQGQHSHAEGLTTIANGVCSHTGGSGTIASGNNQVAFGMYNIEDSKSVLIIGNGTNASTRSNLLTLSWDGSLMVDNVKNQLSDTLVEGLKYQLGILTSDITITLPETATADIEVDFAIADTTYNVNCEYLSLDVVADTYYQIIFSYDKALNMWFSSVISSDYNSTSTISEVEDNESN